MHTRGPKQTRLHQFIALSCLVTLCGCKPGEKAAASQADNPATRCASADTVDGLTNVALGEFAAAAPEAKGIMVSISAPVLDSYDQTTKKVACSADLTLIYPAALQPFAARGALQVSQATYTVQPTADGKSTMYTILPATAAGLQNIAARVIQAERDASKPSLPIQAPSSGSDGAQGGSPTNSVSPSTAGNDFSDTSTTPNAPSAMSPAAADPH